MEMQPLIEVVRDKMTELLREPVLYQAGVTRSEIWDTYMKAIPDEHNPIYLERLVFDCNYCERFITRAGRIQHIKSDLTVDTIWNVQVDDPELQHIANVLHTLVSSASIATVFSHPEKEMMDHIKGAHTYWIPTNTRLLTPGQGGVVVEFTHFHGPEDIPAQHFRSGSDISRTMSSAEVFGRALRELTDAAIETVIDLVEDDALYRAPKLERIKEFLEYHRAHAALTDDSERVRYVYYLLQGKISESITHIRNTSFGTLLVDLSEDMDLDNAVGKYMAIVDPVNYQRSKTVVTKKMVETARAKVNELGLLPSFDRRHATLDDLPVSELMFVDRSVSTNTVNDDIFDTIDEVRATNPNPKAQPITIKSFIESVLPGCKSMEVHTSKNNASHLFNLTTATDSSTKQLFKWPNSFGWNYSGDVTASLRERVKKAGGVVDADICVRLAWDYDDDLDIMLYTCPLDLVNKSHPYVYYNTKRNCGWELDVDANAGGRTMAEPVENMFALDRRILRPGQYNIIVNNYAKRDASASGYEIEVDVRGEPTISLKYDGPTPDKTWQHVCTIEITREHEVKVHIGEKMIKEHRTYSEKGVIFGDFNPVLAMSTSPNYWDNKSIGHQHYFFFLKGYRTDESIRVFYNEFLHESLHDHRKVMEVLGSKTKIQPDGEQLGGLGYMVGEGDTLAVRVHTDNGPRLYDVKF